MTGEAARVPGQRSKDQDQETVGNYGRVSPVQLQLTGRETGQQFQINELSGVALPGLNLLTVKN